MTIAFLFVGAGLNYFTPAEAFEYLTAAVTFIGILVWLAIIYTHSIFRRDLLARGEQPPAFSLPFWPVSSFVAAGFLIAVIVILVGVAQTRAPVLLGLALLCFIGLVYRFTPEARARRNPS
jgi:AAT family amino acid transporter